MFERTAGTPTTPLVTPGTSAIAEKPATGNRQELKGHQQQQECLPLMQATAVTQATTLTGELWRALGCLYSEARLYKGPREATHPQSTTLYSTGG